MPQVSSAYFGPMTSGQLPLDCSVAWRDLPEGGLGINTNYLMDISPEWRNAGGPTFSEALKARLLYWLSCWAVNRIGHEVLIFDNGITLQSCNVTGRMELYIR